MSKKSYIGCCGSCVDCNLLDSYRSIFSYTTTFKCTRYNRSVRADEKACSKYEPDTNRTSEVIEKFDK